MNEAVAAVRTARPRRRQPWTHDVAIIGAGFSGLGCAIKLRAAGVTDLVILERADRVGGTWRDTRYPGAACDIPSLLYSFSFAPNPRWSRSYSPSTEIYHHLEELTDSYELRESIRFGTEVAGMEFDAGEGRWQLHTNTGDVLARCVVVASGPLTDSSWPDIRGIDAFAGHKIHSARWDSDYDMSDRNVAVIGTGASAVQIIPELVRTAGSVKVFQRTAGWVLPRLDVRTPRLAQQLFTRMPAAQQAARAALYVGHEAAATGLVWDSPVTTVIQRLAVAHLHRQVKDPWMRRQLTPDFRAGCKRMLMSSDYYPALQADNCKLITWPIATICPEGIRTSEGIVHAVDCIVFATGYDVHLAGPPFPITGLDGRSLQHEWAGHAQAYKSSSVSGYPNMFLMTGPNSGPGHNSLLVYVQGQIDYAVRGVRTVLDQDLRYLDVRAGAQRRHNARIQRRLGRTTWMSGCSSWYLTADGYNGAMFPGFATQYLRQMHTFRAADYAMVPAVARRARAAETG
jgi:cation diffusion facilitator CzcD-associated flavoprotein CzcO